MFLDRLNETQSVLGRFQAAQNNQLDSTQLSQQLNKIKGSIQEIRMQMAASSEAGKELVPDAGLTAEKKQELYGLLNQIHEDLEEQMDVKYSSGSLFAFSQEFRSTENKKWKQALEEKVNGQIRLLSQVGKFTKDPEAASSVSIRLKTNASLMPSAVASIRQYSLTLKHAEAITSEISGSEIVNNFITKVSNGQATLEDLNPEIMKWIQEHQMAGRMRILI